MFLGRDFSSTPRYSENVAAEIDQEIRDIIDTAYERARDILTEHMDQLHQVAQFLFEHEKMAENEFDAMMKGLPMPEKPDFSIYAHSEEEPPAPKEEPQEKAPENEPSESQAVPGTDVWNAVLPGKPNPETPEENPENTNK